MRRVVPAQMGLSVDCIIAGGPPEEEPEEDDAVRAWKRVHAAIRLTRCLSPQRGGVRRRGTRLDTGSCRRQSALREPRACEAILDRPHPRDARRHH